MRLGAALPKEKWPAEVASVPLRRLYFYSVEEAGRLIGMSRSVAYRAMRSGAIPVEKYGLKLMSLGFLPDAGKGVLLRGPMVAKWVTTFLTQINWGQLDQLVIDMPPGTGDAQLTLCQAAPLTGAVIVTTPQDVTRGGRTGGLARDGA